MAGIQEVVVSVFDIDRVAAPLVEACGFRPVPLPDLSPGELALWGGGEGAAVQQRLLLPEAEDRGAIRLVAFSGRERTLIRPSQRSWDTGGIFDVDLFTTDVRAVYRHLQHGFGWTAFGEPVDYVMGAFDVAQVVATGPDGLVLALIEPHGPPAFPIPMGRSSRVFNSTQLVRDLSATLHFYKDILGWTSLVEMVIDDAVEPGAQVLGLPMPAAQTCRRRVAIVHPDGTNDGSVELIENADMRGHDFAARAVAPNVGILALRIAIGGVTDYAAAIVARGGALERAPQQVEIAALGAVTLFAVRSPDGALIEFFEPVA